MPWAAAITAAGSIASSAISSSKKSNSTQQQQQTDTSHTPWAPQDGALQAGLGEAQGVYSDRSMQGPYTGALYAGTNDLQKGAAGYAAGYGSSSGVAGADRAFQIGGQANTALADATGVSSGVAHNGIGPQNGALMGTLQGYATGDKPIVSGDLSGALKASATAGARSIGGFNAGLSDVMATAQQDPTHQLSADAAEYMNNPALQAQLDNVHRQIDSTLTEQTVPGLNRAASLGGNLNSSRAGMAEAMANRDAAMAKGNADAQILSHAYDTGLGVASAQRTSGLNTAASAGSAGIAANANLALGAGNQDIASAQTAIGAANSGLVQGTTHQTADASARLAGSGQLMNDANSAVNATTASSNLAGNAASLIGSGGQLMQSDEQQKLNEEYAKYKMGNEYQQGILSDYMKTVTMPSGYYQANQTSNTTSTPPSSLPTLIAGGATALGSQFKQGGIFNSKNADGTSNDSYISNWFGGGKSNDSTWTPQMEAQAQAYNDSTGTYNYSSPE